MAKPLCGTSHREGRSQDDIPATDWFTPGLTSCQSSGGVPPQPRIRPVETQTLTSSLTLTLAEALDPGWFKERAAAQRRFEMFTHLTHLPSGLLDFKRATDVDVKCIEMKLIQGIHSLYKTTTGNTRWGLCGDIALAVLFFFCLKKKP